MPLLSAAQLASMQATTAATVFDKLADIQTAGRTDDGAGGYIEGWTTTTAAVPCLLEIRPRTPFEGVAGSRLDTVGDWIISFPVGTSVTGAQRVVISGRTFEITAPMPGDTFEIMVVIYAQEVR